MPNCDKLLERVRNSPQNVRFSELCALAECFGFVLRRIRGSHHLYSRPGFARPLNFQNENGKTNEYQVKQLLEAIDELNDES